MQLVSVVGAGTMVTAVDSDDEREMRKQRRKRMGELALRWVPHMPVQQIGARSSVCRWKQQMGLAMVGERRASALVRAVACSDFALRRGVWLRLIDSFWVQRRGADDGWRIQKKKVRGEGRGEGKGDAVRHDWSCARCGWGGCCMVARATMCRKCTNVLDLYGKRMPQIMSDIK